ncbi:hypothetical protein ACMU_10420 [Actibacterium mucosum KCTC 23349]|uniref:Methyltransferase domain-containing protein n=1 Tax=Actibacterium mucosum KCTC 23349 TaxID=1454373 RepID=A0A037ZKS5_9RHOB|nr:class I SAM-dependent methyltransferase [Actibacterium mucosum]KAJ56157.1 hypothetical protein ACMU_10420 [Actibacterium mucosum KCTC 23349]
MPDPAGASFQDADVVDLYPHRPPYATQALDHIHNMAPDSGRLLDLGCGEGKIARPMTPRFDQVVAVDPSANMIALGRTLPRGDAANLTWLQAYAEDAPLAGAFDVVTFASSIHWMNPEQLFDRLAPHLHPRHLLAVVSGDTPHDPPWQDAWQGFLDKWVPALTGQPVNSAQWCGSRRAYLDHVEVVDTQSFLSEPVQQSVDSFIKCQHSRDTFALSKLGSRRAAFHRELAALLHPHADDAGQLTYRVKTDVTLATLTGAVG